MNVNKRQLFCFFICKQTLLRVKMISSQNYSQVQNVLEAKMDNAKSMSVMLKSVHFKDIAMVCASENGIKVTVDDSKCIIAHAYVQADLFRHYYLKEKEVTFRVNLAVLLECLNIFGGNLSSNTAFELCYAGKGSPLVLLLEESGVLTNCSIKTMEAEECLNFDFNNANILNKLIIRSECLKEIFSELDSSSDVLEITLSPDKPYFRLSTFGNTGSYHWDFPKDSEVMEEFDCKELQVNKYKMSLIKHTTKALMASNMTSMRTDDRGFLSIQFMIKPDTGHTCFTEYLCTPDIEDDSL